MDVKENVSLGNKTTMKIGGTAKYFAELENQADCEAALAFAKEKNVPMITLGGGSNTLFEDGEINALVVRVKADVVDIKDDLVTVQAGKNLMVLINELAEVGLDISALTGILGNFGGAIFGNAGQGPKGIWIDSYVQSVTAYVDGQWQEFTSDDCNYRYRESGFKDLANQGTPLIIWEATLKVPKKESTDIKAEIERLVQKRVETQPHVKTAGSCFKAVGGTPAWQLIDEVGLRGHRVGGVHVSEKHANFLINDEGGSCANAKQVIADVREKIPTELEVEMRFFGSDGKLQSI